MSYMRGDFYLWSDGERLHLWAANGYDGWDDSIWAQGVQREGERPSGVALPLQVIDAFVVMRLAEIIDDKRLAAVIDRAVAGYGGNGGCRSLTAKAAALKAALAQLE